MITGEKLKEELRRCLQQKTLEAVPFLVAKRLDAMPNTYSGGDVIYLRGCMPA